MYWWERTAWKQDLEDYATLSELKFLLSYPFATPLPRSVAQFVASLLLKKYGNRSVSVREAEPRKKNAY